MPSVALTPSRAIRSASCSPGGITDRLGSKSPVNPSGIPRGPMERGMGVMVISGLLARSAGIVFGSFLVLTFGT